MNDIIVSSSFNETGMIPTGLYAVPKDKFIEYNHQVISKMKKEIAEMNLRIVSMDPNSFDYKKCEKGIKRRNDIIATCEQAIRITRAQIKALKETNERYRIL